MEIDNHILSLSMEFERLNIIINEYETNKAKQAHDRIHSKRRKTAKNRQKSPEEGDSDKDKGKGKDEDAYEGDKEESGFEDNGSDTKDDDFDESLAMDDKETETKEDKEDEKDKDEEDEDEKVSIKPSSAKSSKVQDATDDEEDGNKDTIKKIRTTFSIDYCVAILVPIFQVPIVRRDINVIGTHRWFTYIYNRYRDIQRFRLVWLCV